MNEINLDAVPGFTTDHRLDGMFNTAGMEQLIRITTEDVTGLPCVVARWRDELAQVQERNPRAFPFKIEVNDGFYVLPFGGDEEPEEMWNITDFAAPNYFSGPVTTA